MHQEIKTEESFHRAFRRKIVNDDLSISYCNSEAPQGMNSNQRYIFYTRAVNIFIIFFWKGGNLCPVTSTFSGGIIV